MASLSEDTEIACKDISGLSALGRGRRKVLADLDSNDSPIVGLIPGVLDRSTSRTPGSCDFKSALGSQNCRLKQHLASTELGNSLNTPLGEKLLRSQVKRLLQQVEANGLHQQRQAPSLRALCHLQTFMDSPGLKFVAPTPFNTPCTNITACAQAPPGTLSSSEVSMPTTSTSLERISNHALEDQTLYKEDQQDDGVKKVQDANVDILENSHLCPAGESIAASFHSKLSARNGQITIADCVVTGRDCHITQVAPLIFKEYHQGDLPTTLGAKTTRILQFESPEKPAAISKPPIRLSELKSAQSSFAQQLDDDSANLLVKLDIEADLGCQSHSGDTGNGQSKPSKPVCRKGTPFPKKKTSCVVDVDDDVIAEDDKRQGTWLR